MIKDDLQPGQAIDGTMNIIITVATNTIALDIDAQMIDDNGEIVRCRMECDPSTFRYFRDEYVQYLDEDYDIDTDFGEDEDLMYIIVNIPRDAVSLDVRTCCAVKAASGTIKTRWQDDRHMRASDIHEARELFLKRIPFGDDYNARYTLTDKGREALADILSGRKTPEEIFGDDYFEGIDDD